MTSVVAKHEGAGNIVTADISLKSSPTSGCQREGSQGTSTPPCWVGSHREHWCPVPAVGMTLLQALSKPQGTWPGHTLWRDALQGTPNLQVLAEALTRPFKGLPHVSLIKPRKVTMAWWSNPYCSQLCFWCGFRRGQPESEVGTRPLGGLCVVIALCMPSPTSQGQAGGRAGSSRLAKGCSYEAFIGIRAGFSACSKIRKGVGLQQIHWLHLAPGRGGRVCPVMTHMFNSQSDLTSCVPNPGTCWISEQQMLEPGIFVGLHPPVSEGPSTLLLPPCLPLLL